VRVNDAVFVEGFILVVSIAVLCSYLVCVQVFSCSPCSGIKKLCICLKPRSDRSLSVLLFCSWIKDAFIHR
jgi:hypothetical protein